MKQAITGKNDYGAELARLAQLRYVSDEQTGYSRQLNGSGFKYLNSAGRELRDKRQIERITGLVIPPAWKQVWICRFADGHLQATGFDSRKRKQYLYHPRWQETANLAKFARLRDFGKVLPSIRRKVQARLKGNQLTRSRVLAGMVAILDATSIRVGNEEYVKANNSYGLSTLRNRHLRFERGRAILQFVGKSGVKHEGTITAKQCVRLLRQCHKLPGPHVFQYLSDDGIKHQATANEVNEFLQETTGESFTAKDFRSWSASALVMGLLMREKDEVQISARKRIIREAVMQGADLLRNTQATTRKYYVHPRILESFEEGSFPLLIARFKQSARCNFSQNEQLLAHFLKRLEG
jgi:DNA topoisomerase I